jgi:hypothetical protein
MLKEILLKMATPLTLMVLFLIVGLAPLYLMAGLMTRSFSTTSPSPVSRPQSSK